MQSFALAKSLIQSFLTTARHELYLFWHFTKWDWHACIMPSSFFALSAAWSIQLPTLFLYRYLYIVCWVSLYIYFFDLTNQINGVEEDRINKPVRPLPSGKVTLEGANRRWKVVVFLWLAISLGKSTFIPDMVVWYAVTMILCTTSLGNHWFFKNTVFMTLANGILLDVAWKGIMPHTPESWHFLVSFAVWGGLIMQVQDFRDIRGDTATKRQTLPIMFGETTARLLTAFGFIPASVAVLILGGIFRIAPGFLALSHLWIAVRILQTKGSRYDHETYMVCNISITAVSCSIQRFIGLDVPSVFNPCALLGWRHVRREHCYQLLVPSSLGRALCIWFCCALLALLVIELAECSSTRFFKNLNSITWVFGWSTLSVAGDTHCVRAIIIQSLRMGSIPA